MREFSLIKNMSDLTIAESINPDIRNYEQVFDLLKNPAGLHPGQVSAIVWALYSIRVLATEDNYVRYNDIVEKLIKDERDSVIAGDSAAGRLFEKCIASHVSYKTTDIKSFHKINDKKRRDYYSYAFIDVVKNRTELLAFLPMLQAQLILNHQERAKSIEGEYGISNGQSFPYHFVKSNIDKKIDNLISEYKKWEKDPEVLKLLNDQDAQNESKFNRTLDRHIHEVLTHLLIINSKWASSEEEFTEQLLYQIAVEHIYHTNLILSMIYMVLSAPIRAIKPFDKESDKMILTKSGFRVSDETFDWMLYRMEYEANNVFYYQKYLEYNNWDTTYLNGYNNCLSELGKPDLYGIEDITRLAKSIIVGLYIKNDKNINAASDELSALVNNHREQFEWATISHCDAFSFPDDNPLFEYEITGNIKNIIVPNIFRLFTDRLSTKMKMEYLRHIINLYSDTEYYSIMYKKESDELSEPQIKKEIKYIKVDLTN